jgi:hypothetical protein
MNFLLEGSNALRELRLAARAHDDDDDDDAGTRAHRSHGAS